MFDLIDVYEPDDILMDIDSDDYLAVQEEDVDELYLDDNRDAVRGMSYLRDEVNAPDELFVI